MGSNEGLSLSTLLTSAVVIIGCVAVSLGIALAAYELILDTEFEIPL